MNKFFVLCVTAAFVILASAASAQYTNKDNDEVGVPAGMEVRKVNDDVSVLVPKGARMYNRNRTTYVEESADEYAARNVAQLKDRLKKLEAENKVLVEEINYLKSQIVIPEKAAASEKTAEENATEENVPEPVQKE